MFEFSSLSSIRCSQGSTSVVKKFHEVRTITSTIVPISVLVVVSIWRSMFRTLLSGFNIRSGRGDVSFDDLRRLPSVLVPLFCIVVPLLLLLLCPSRLPITDSTLSSTNRIAELILSNIDWIKRKICWNALSGNRARSDRNRSMVLKRPSSRTVRCRVGVVASWLFNVGTAVTRSRR